MEKYVRVAWTKRDRYGRILGDVFLADRRISLEMIRDGRAWHFKKNDSEKTLADA